jgi:hypothetical protein
MTALHQPRNPKGAAEWLCKAKNRVLEPTTTTTRTRHTPRQPNDRHPCPWIAAREQLERGGGTASSCAILDRPHGYSRQASPLILQHPLDAHPNPCGAFHTPCEVHDRDLQRARESAQNPPRRVAQTSLNPRQVRRVDARCERQRFDRHPPFMTQLTDRPTKITARRRARSSVTAGGPPRTYRAALPHPPHHASPRSIASRRARATTMKPRSTSTC